jgi:hypothetical protein
LVGTGTKGCRAKLRTDGMARQPQLPACAGEWPRGRRAPLAGGAWRGLRQKWVAPSPAGRIRTYRVHYEGFQVLSTACSFLPSRAWPGARHLFLHLFLALFLHLLWGPTEDTSPYSSWSWLCPKIWRPGNPHLCGRKSWEEGGAYPDSAVEAGTRWWHLNGHLNGDRSLSL